MANLREEEPPPSACPVDPSARAAWLQNAEEARLPYPLKNPPSTSAPPTPPLLNSRTQPLDSSRVTSSIPRAETSPATTTPLPTSTPSLLPPTTSNWIYPSEKMFFEAMTRKNHTPHAPDMSAVVPIHNAVNERAWAEIKTWESSSPRLLAANSGCGGPRLRSFRGDSKKLTPRARVNGWLGYEEPFDRHDWVVERCGGPASEVEYVIDFYKGRGGGLSFYLDVRPKLNSWEGWRMRIGRALGV